MPKTHSIREEKRISLMQLTINNEAAPKVPVLYKFAIRLMKKYVGTRKETHYTRRLTAAAGHIS